jgi:hypothetical protein
MDGKASETVADIKENVGEFAAGSTRKGRECFYFDFWKDQAVFGGK